MSKSDYVKIADKCDDALDIMAMLNVGDEHTRRAIRAERDRNLELHEQMSNLS